jgi:hypothetical protein
MMVCPEIDQMTGKFGAIVGKKIFRCTVLADETIQNLDYMFATKTLADFDCQALPAEHIDDSQSAELLPIAELIMHEVQAPGFVRPLRAAPCFAVHDHLTPPWTLAA